MEQLGLNFALPSVELKVTEKTARMIAKEKGEKRYFDGTICGNGYVAERYTASGKCWQCRDDSYRKSYAEKKEHILNRQKEWRLKNKDRIASQGKEYRELNSETIKRKKERPTKGTSRK
jgi:hypothetical protein